MTKSTNIDDKVVRSIVQQWNGGEHMLAGARASEAIYGAGDKPDRDLYAAIVEEIPGITKYVVVPKEVPVTQVPDEGGYPLTSQPENMPEATGASNLSSEKAKDEQDAIDEALAPGREARQESIGTTELGSTEMNPPASNVPATDAKPDDAKVAEKTTKAKAPAKAKAKVASK
jgi:hypothetical protein